MTTPETEITTPAGEPVIEVRRFLQAPPELVYRALTECEFLSRWWGPRRLENVECESDLGGGGTWRIVQRAPDGMEFAFHGEFRELERPTAGWPRSSSRAPPLVLEAVEGGTMLTQSTRHDSVEPRDMHIAAGMEGGSSSPSSVSTSSWTRRRGHEAGHRRPDAA